MQQRQQQQKQQQQKEDAAISSHRQEEYRAAQRAAVESIMVGRATAETVQHQGEQLQRAENIADETQYKLDKATRLLKGMTWSGWVGNMFTADVQAPTPKSTCSKNATNFDAYDDLPEACQAAAQAIKNYHANVSVLEDCETEDQKQTLILICNDMFQTAEKQLKTIAKNKQFEAYALQLTTDLESIRKRQLTSQTQVRGLVDRVTCQAVSAAPSALEDTTAATEKQKEELFGRKPASSVTATTKPKTPTKAAASPPTADDPLQQQQDEHLEVIAASLGELNTIADSLNTGLGQQQAVMDQLDTKSENVLETSKMVSRRADRLATSKSWSGYTKHVFDCDVAIRHLDSGKYVAVTTAGDMRLVNTYNKEQCQFALHKRQQQGKLFGLRSAYNRKWVGQNLLGNLCVTATYFGRRQEWEADDDDENNWKNTRLLCASAGWGQGGYLQVSSHDFSITIGGSTVADSKTAARFSIVKVNSDDNNKEQQK